MRANNSGILENDLNTSLLKNLNFELTDDQMCEAIGRVGEAFL